MTKELSTELSVKKYMYKKWKSGENTREEYKQIASICRGKVRKAKVQNGLRLARQIKNNKKRKQ